MRIVTRNTRLEGIVSCRIDLGESGRAGGIEGMAQGAEFPHARCLRLHFRGIIGMSFGRAMACLAG